MMSGGMMGSGTDPGKVMGALLASAPRPRVSAAAALYLCPVPGHAQKGMAGTLTIR
jgi:uncharacterized cupredoxin-like copper-binding protein